MTSPIKLVWRSGWHWFSRHEFYFRRYEGDAAAKIYRWSLFLGPLEIIRRR